MPAVRHVSSRRPATATKPRRRPIAADRPPDASDLRRLLAAGGSAVLPGLGQLLNGRAPLARRFLLPSLALLGITWVLLQLVPASRLVATAVNPAVLNGLIVVNFLVLVWRLAAVAQAFFDTRFPTRPGKGALAGLIALAIFVGLPHGMATAYGFAARDAFARIFEPGSQPAPGQPPGEGEPRDGTDSPVEPRDQERINVLLIGIDAAPWRESILTDTLMVVSIDPVGRTISMLSIPRDTINVPLGNGRTWEPKINALMSYADEHRKAYPEGGTRALMNAIGALLGIDVHYHATVDFFGFMEMIDAVGGVDVTVDKGFYDPTYEFWQDQYGWGISAGRHNLNGREALAYARARKASGESDFTRAARQQQLILAFRHKVTSAGTLVEVLPRLLDTLGETVRTDFPIARLPDVAALVDEIPDDRITRVVIKHPLVRGARNNFGSVQIPDVRAIREMAARLFSAPGTPPTPWPTPKPTRKPTPSPTAAPG